MADRKYDVLALFSDDIHGYDLEFEINRLNGLGVGRLWPLSAKRPSLGFLIYEVKESSLDEVLVVLNRQSSVKFAGPLPRRYKSDPSGPNSSCRLNMDK